MEIKRVCAVYFSPTWVTRQLTETLAGQLSERLGVPMTALDFTLPGDREGRYSFSTPDLVVFGMPTYAGKLPNKLLPYVKEGFAGGAAPAAALVSFGNRSFDNSLAELCACLSADGFIPFAGAAFAVQHAFSDTLAAGRPDAADLETLSAFGERILARLRDGAPLSPVCVPGDAQAPYYMPRGLDGEPKNFLKARPKTDPLRCTRCGFCASHCPMGSIDGKDCTRVAGLCIKCHACVRGCPNGAKYFDDEAFLSHRAMLERDYTRRAAPALFV